MTNREFFHKLNFKKRKKAVKDRAKPLQKAGVDTVDSVITTSTTGNEAESTVSPEAVEKLKSMLNRLGVKVIVGVNGNVVLKSEDVLFVSKQLVESGDIENIVKGVAYDLHFTMN